MAEKVAKDPNFQNDSNPTMSTEIGDVYETGGNVDQLQRRLGNRHIQLIAIGGSIGTGLFINIGMGLAKGGPASLLIGLIIHCCFMALVNNCIAEMTVLLPVSGGFIRMADKWVDSALGFMAGWNFFLYEAILIPFEITALSVVLSYWRDDIPSAAVTAVVIVLYAAFNMLPVGLYGESEFWLSSGKVVLVFILFGFTFFTMIGVNPQGDAYGFQYWSNPGPFAEWHTTGNLGRFEGLLNVIWVGTFIVVGPEYLSMAAAETKLPRVYVKSAYKTVYFHFGLFFIGSALATGIVLPYNDPTLQALASGEKSGGSAASSPYVIAMRHLGITILPDIVNALIFRSILSAGNTYTFCAMRSLYSMALEGRAPRVLTRCTNSGIPIYCLAITSAFSCLAFLQESSGTLIVLNWFVNLVTAGCIISFIVICITYLRFHRACQVQGIERKSFPYYAYFQPYGAWLGLAWTVFVVLGYGYSSFAPWDVGTFFSYYAIAIFAIAAYSGWKIVMRSRIVKVEEIDLVWERPTIDAYEAVCEERPVGFWREIWGMARWRGNEHGAEA
ncbi:amino acid permease/ SLC12A domain-containing protein [Aspergillus keveii]|uniref:Amino acid permease/ SLC12A domain-containing protein n=1 Tax=Aspergillus keveii TaxID=714993 RepID=A0ABR4G6L9_9EURO